MKKGDFNSFKREVIDRSLEDIKVELDGEFDRNFERKAFFEKKWPERKYDDGVGSLLVRSGALRRSISSRRSGAELTYTSDRPYARIHNEGGEIKVTKKMKKYFWAKYKETTGKYSYGKKTETITTKRGKVKEKKILKETKENESLSGAAEFYKAMALKKEGSSIVIPERRFIGVSKETDKIIREIAEGNIEDFFKKHNLFEQ
jgi:phage gpG-like protein